MFDSKNHKNKITLEGFNNLTKSLSFNIYDICYAKTPRQREEYLAYIDEQYNAERLTDILRNVTQIIGAEILNIARQDYEPQGASVTILVAEGHMHSTEDMTSEAPGPKGELPPPEAVVAHLDKSHIAAHTYPEYHPDNGICTFRTDIDVATCGLISPLKALNYLIHSFDSDVVMLDYRVRGFTRDVHGQKHYIDHDIHSIQNYLPDDLLERYEVNDVNIQQENLFNTKMLLRDFNIDNYLFGAGQDDFEEAELKQVEKRLKKEMIEIFHCQNFTSFPS